MSNWGPELPDWLEKMVREAEEKGEELGICVN